LDINEYFFKTIKTIQQTQALCGFYIAYFALSVITKQSISSDDFKNFPKFMTEVLLKKNTNNKKNNNHKIINNQVQLHELMNSNSEPIVMECDETQNGYHLPMETEKDGFCVYCRSIGRRSYAAYTCFECKVYLHSKCFYKYHFKVTNKK